MDEDSTVCALIYHPQLRMMGVEVEVEVEAGSVEIQWHVSRSGTEPPSA